MSKCISCGKEFSRPDSLARHQKGGACVHQQALAVVASHHHGGGGGDDAITPPSTTPVVTLPSIGPVVQKADGSFITEEALLAQLQLPAQPRPINWRKWVVIGGLGLLVIGGIWWAASTSQRRSDPSPAPVRLPGGMDGLIPPALFGIVGLLLFAKMLRGEITAWDKLLTSWAR